MKLAYIERFTRFISWPENDGSIGAEFNIGIIDNNPFGKTIEQIANQKQIKGKPIKFKTITSPEEVSQCDLIFIPEKHEINIDTILKRVEKNKVLVISENKGYASLGSMINLKLKYGELKFEINKKTIDRNGFTVHSKLYQIAEKVIK